MVMKNIVELDTREADARQARRQCQFNRTKKIFLKRKKETCSHKLSTRGDVCNPCARWETDSCFVHAVKEHSFLRLGLCFFVGAGRLLAFCGFGLPFGPECCPTFLGWGSLVGFPGVKRRFADKSLVVFCGLVTRAVQDWLQSTDSGRGERCGSDTDLPTSPSQGIWVRACEIELVRRLTR